MQNSKTMPVMPQQQTLALLQRFRLDMPRQLLAKNPKQLHEFEKKLSYPVVVKAISPQATHKTEAGLLRLNIPNESQLAQAYHEIEASAKKQKLPLEAFLVQEQAKGVELFVGAKRDPSFGPVIAFGLGGILVELLQETSLRIAPFDKNEATAMIQETRARKFVQGFRGKKVSENAVVDAIMKAQKIMLANPKIMELDFNPIICDEQRARVVDARVVTA
ncbi:MAG TPA: acetate--CoA ligase family protein [Candidatus Norongarragalinales archaeon]|nr:acetate--CoA ligase family protein [Candidatus Norongarragalinales archaeon]